MIENTIATIQTLAGSISSLLFAAGTLPMILKAFKTRNLKSYSLGYIGMSNLGNLIYWIYITGLPVGPIWFLHFFNTTVALLMLALYLRFEKGCRIAALSQCVSSFPACITG